MDELKPYEILLAEKRELEYQLSEAKDTIEAIRNGQVDALVVRGKEGHQLFTLKNADQTYRVFIEKMAEGAVTVNRDGTILYSNSRFATMVNLPLEKVIGSLFEGFVDETFALQFEKLIKSGWEQDSKEEILIVSPNHDKKFCLLSCNTLELDEGTALSIIITDLTVQRAIQNQLKIKNEELEEARRFTEKLNNELEASVKERTQELFDSRENFKMLADNVPQIIWTYLPDGQVNFYSEQWYEYTGLSKQQPEDRLNPLVNHPDEAAEVRKNFRASLISGKPFVMEFRIRRKDGEYHWYLHRSIPLRNEKGEITLWIGSATDIEDQKRAMDKKDEFIGIASHELKTPLTSLKGYLQIIADYQKEQLPPIIKQFVKKANDSANKLLYLVNDLLDVSKINAGKLDYSKSPMKISDLIDSCIENASHIYPSHNIEDKGNNDYMVNGNLERLEQVLMNFINNAVKYASDSKKILIDVLIVNDQIKISVTDFGIGLTEEQQEKIFERFYRVEDKYFTTSGLGMGLYICTVIITAHGGQIGVKSEFGLGSTFYFTLPLLA